MKIVKRVIEGISKPITYIFNLSFHTGKFPNEMKRAKVVPLYKTGDRQVPKLQAYFFITTIFQNSTKTIFQ